MPLPPLKHGKFECSGDGFTFSSHRRADPSTIALELGNETRPPPTGRISKQQTTTKHPKSWWEAQVRLYGLQCSKWTIEGMKAVLTTALQNGLEVPEDLKTREQELNEQYQTDSAGFETIENIVRHERARAQRLYDAATSDIERANADPKRFLRKLAEDGGVKVLYGISRVQQMAEELGLFAKSIDGVLAGYDGEILVVGRDREAVLSKVKRIEEVVKSHKEKGKGPGKRDVAERQEEIASRTANHEHIGGLWELDIPKLSHYDDETLLSICKPDGSDYVWGKFDIIILEGIMRIDWISPPSIGQGKEKNFVWRGREVVIDRGGDVIQMGEMQSDDAENGGNITFLSSNRCAGELWWSGYDTYEFTGEKVSMDQAVTIDDCELDFENYNIDNANEEYMNENYNEEIDSEECNESLEEDSGAEDEEEEEEMEDDSDYF